MAGTDGSGRFSALLLEGLDHYRKGRMMEAVRAWEEAYLLEPTNLRAREFLRSALERIHAHMGADGQVAAAAEPAKPPSHPWLPNVDKAPSQPPPAPAAASPAPGPAPAVAPVGPQPITHVAVKHPDPPWQPFADQGRQPFTDQGRAPFADQPRPTFMEPPTDSPKTPPRMPAGRSPWDDGPSRAIEQPEVAGDEASGAWSIHKEALPVEALADDETDVWMRGARELVALNDFSGALELLAKILVKKPNDRDALSMHELCEHNLTLMYESKLGSMELRPSVAIPPDEIIWLNLDPRAGFVLAQIDGEVSFDDLYAICGLKRLDTARILCELLEQGVVSVAGQDRAVAKRAMHRT